MHQASPPIADLTAVSPHSPSPEFCTQEARQCVVPSIGMKSEPSDMTDADRETAIELYELREIWFDTEGLHSKAEEARAMQQQLIQGRKHGRRQK